MIPYRTKSVHFCVLMNSATRYRDVEMEFNSEAEEFLEASAFRMLALRFRKAHPKTQNLHLKT